MAVKIKPYYEMTSNFGFYEMTSMFSIFCKKYEGLHHKGQ